MQTPEQTILGITSEEPWESCITMVHNGIQPTNEYKKQEQGLLKF